MNTKGGILILFAGFLLQSCASLGPVAESADQALKRTAFESCWQQLGIKQANLAHKEVLVMASGPDSGFLRALIEAKVRDMGARPSYSKYADVTISANAKIFGVNNVLKSFLIGRQNKRIATAVISFIVDDDVRAMQRIDKQIQGRAQLTETTVFGIFRGRSSSSPEAKALVAQDAGAEEQPLTESRATMADEELNSLLQGR